MRVTDLKESLFGGSDTEAEVGPTEHGPIVRLLLAVRQSLTYFTLATGVVMIVSGFLVELVFRNQGVLAAMMVIWGISAIVVGVIGYAVVRALKLR